MRKRSIAAFRLAVLAAAALGWSSLSAAAQVRPLRTPRTLHVVRHVEAKPFAFRGIALGITLDAFRRTAPVRAVPAGSVAVCDTDAAAGALGMDLRSNESVTVSCRWAHRAEDGWRPSRAVLAGTVALDHVLRFVRMPDQRAYRLYEMSFVVGERVAGEVRDALADRYGQPKLETTAAGAVPIYVWHKPSSSITLIYLPASHKATLTYLLDDPDAWLKSVARRWLADNPDAG